jgi:hypothetical protein
MIDRSFCFGSTHRHQKNLLGYFFSICQCLWTTSQRYCHGSLVVARGLTLGESPGGHISRKRKFRDCRYPRPRLAIISSFFTQQSRRLFLFVHDCCRQKELSYSFIHAHLNNLIFRYRVSKCERKTRNCAYHVCTNPNPARRTFITGGFGRRILPQISDTVWSWNKIHWPL